MPKKLNTGKIELCLKSLTVKYRSISKAKGISTEIPSVPLLCVVNFRDMDLETFENLKEGDRVICNYGSGATVIKTGVIDNLKKSKMVKLKVDKKKWSCPYFFRSELKCIE